MSGDRPVPGERGGRSSMPTERDQLRQPRLAELIAGVLRDRIMRGDYLDGEHLPKQEDLLEEFHVSKPSVREALRVLETEGLVHVRRGNKGGAVVHRPQSRDAAYMLGLVLQSKKVSLADVGHALLQLEPACGGLCAGRSDRQAVVDRLSEIQHLAEQSVMDDIAFVEHMRQFHEVLVHECGNETMKTVVGALEVLWSAQEHAWAHSAAGTDEYPGLDMRERGLQAHARILELIAGGDSGGVIRVAGSHLRAAQLYTLAGPSHVIVDAVELRASQGRGARR